MLDDETLLKAMADILDAIGAEDFLLQVGEIVDRRTGLGMVQTQALDLKTGRAGDTLFSRGYAMDVAGEYERWVFATDPRVPAVQARLGTISACWQLIEPEKFDRSEIVRGWLDRPEIDMRWGMAGALPVEDGTAMLLAVMRPRREGAHSAEDVTAVQQLAPILRRAGRLHLRLAGERARPHALAEASARRGEAMVLLDGEMRLVLTNSVGEGLIDAGAAALDRCGRFVLKDPASQARLDAAVEAALPGAHASHGDSAFPVRLLDRVHICRVIALGGIAPSHGFPPRATVAVFVSDPLAARPAVAALRRFGLTQSEAETASAVANGETVSEIADRRRTSVDTVRTQIKIAMQKLGVRRQVDLTRFVARLT